MTPAALAGPREIVDDATRREFLSLLGAAGLVAGCGARPRRDLIVGTSFWVEEAMARRAG